MSEIVTKEMVDKLCKNTLMEHLGMEFIEVSKGKVIATMPVDKRTVQPMGRLHGGATMALAESIGSIGSLAFIDTNTHSVVGIDINGTHISSSTDNTVQATGILVYQGRTTHVWEIKIEDEHAKLLSICRLTCRVIANK